MRPLFALLLLSLTIHADPKQARSCAPATATQQTQWGHMPATVDLLSMPVSALAGVIIGFETPAEGVLVEAYKYEPDVRLPDISGERQRLSACITSKSGRFAFDLPSGSYELRASKSDWNSTTILVTVDKKKGKRKDIRVVIRVGT